MGFGIIHNWDLERLFWLRVEVAGLGGKLEAKLVELQVKQNYLRFRSEQKNSGSGKAKIFVVQVNRKYCFLLYVQKYSRFMWSKNIVFLLCAYNQMKAFFLCWGSTRWDLPKETRTLLPMFWWGEFVWFGFPFKMKMFKHLLF